MPFNGSLYGLKGFRRSYVMLGGLEFREFWGRMISKEELQVSPA